MTFKAWIPPAGEVVDPPVANWRLVDVLFSDRDTARGLAGHFNWSGEGDGPKIIAYSVVEEYVEETPGDFLARAGTDARKWAEEFHKAAKRLGYSEMDEGWLFGWFANAIETARPHPAPSPLEVLPEAPLDLTKITTPFGLLDEATQAAFKAHGGPMEYASSATDWEFVPVIGSPLWVRGNVYRVAPSAAPAKPAPREVVAWAVVDDKGSPTIFYGEGNAMNWQREEGGTVRPLGFLP